MSYFTQEQQIDLLAVSIDEALAPYKELVLDLIEKSLLQEQKKRPKIRLRFGQ
ncbi:MAG: hypothetical protein HC817_06635 [Saprospiraceae bacterium]|nr:hypothetical protein [Saprospiraceae bacterium]